MVLNLLYEKHGTSEGKPPKRAVGIKLSEGMPVPAELEGNLNSLVSVRNLLARFAAHFCCKARMAVNC